MAANYKINTYNLKLSRIVCLILRDELKNYKWDLGITSMLSLPNTENTTAYKNLNEYSTIRLKSFLGFLTSANTSKTAGYI